MLHILKLNNPEYLNHPEDDFLSWYRKLKNAAPYPNKVANFYIDFSKLVISISENGFLPDPISEFAIQFLDELCDNIITPIFNRVPSDESQFSIMKDFIFLFFQISLYGIYSLDKNCIKIAHFILNSKNSPFINSKFSQNRFFYQAISEEYLKLGIIDHINTILPNQIQSTELLMYIASIYSSLSYFIIKFDLLQLFHKVSESLSMTIQIDHDTLNLSLILDILRDRLFQYNNDQKEEIKEANIKAYTDTFLPIISPFLLSENLEQRINTFNEINKILNDKRFDEKFKQKISIYLAVDDQQLNTPEYSILANFKFHKEYKNSITSIFSCLSKYQQKMLDQSVLRKIWTNNQNLSSSDHFIFFEIFLSLADHDDEGDVLTTVINCILYNYEFTDQNVFEWFEMIDFLIQKLESRHTSVKSQIEMVRHVLWSISFQSSESPLTNFVNVNCDMVERARQSLTKIINVEPNEDDFSQLIDKLNTDNDPFLYTLLNEFLKDPQLQISEEEIQSMIDQTMFQLNDEFSNSKIDEERRTKIYNFFLCLCKFSNSSFNEDQIDRLCSLQDVIPDFFSLLLNLSYSDTINEFDLEKIIDRINPESINKTFFKFIKKIIVEVNGIIDSNIRILPLKHENTLWHFATSDTKIRNHSMKFLCKLYSLNDGEQLSDERMIVTFLEHWFVYYSNDPNDDHLLNLLKIFIEAIECQSFRDPFLQVPHRYCENEILVHVHNMEKTINISLPSSGQVGMVIDKVSIETKIEMNSFELFFNEQKLKRNQFLVDLIQKSEKSDFELNLNLVRTNNNSNRTCHHRTHLPSIVFVNNPVMPILDIYKKIEENNKNAFDLLQVLPTLSFTPDFKDRLNSEVFLSDIENVFDTSKPLVFFYNLETLLRQNQIANICQNHDFIFYLYQHSIGLFKKLDGIENKNELISLLIVFLKRALFIITDNEIRRQIFYLFVKCSIEMEHSIFESISMVIQIIKQINGRNFHIDFPKDNFEEMFEYLLMNDDSNVRNISISLFNFLNVSMTVFLKTIEKFKGNVSVEFLQTVDYHFNDDRKEVPNESISSAFLLLLENSNGHFLNALLSIIIKILKFEIISKNDQQKLLKFLVKRFLILDFSEDDRIAFNNASSCLSQLSHIRCNSSPNQNQEEATGDDYNSEVMKIIENPDSNEPLLKQVLSLHHDNLFFKETQFSHFMINGDESAISPFNRVGLKNLGNTCYVNAILQQFFAIKPLRNSIMSYSGDHPLLAELSHLFFLMKHAKTKFVNPSFMIEKWEMRPNEFLNPRIQHDAAEMMQFLISVFENGEELKETVNSLFVGQFSHPIDGIDLEYHTETAEPFDLVELKVQECKDLKDSFLNLSKPELFLNDSQYFAEDLGYRINAKRSTFIQKAPPVLIIHLMRFYYNYSMNKKNKITNPFTIYKTIDISNVCTDKQAKMTYSLIGVIVHNGNAECGHYFSFVYKKKKNVWLCFNDENVTEVDEKEVLKQGSGESSYDSTGYILFYEKVEVDSIFERGIEKVEPSEKIQSEIDQINKETKKAKLMCSNGYFNLMQNLALQTSIEYFDVCLKYSTDTLPFIHQQTELNGKYFTCLRNKFKAKDDSFKKSFLDFVLNPITDYFLKALFFCPYQEIRHSYCDLILVIFNSSSIDPLPTAICAFQVVDHFWEDYQHCDSIFKILYELYKKFTSVREWSIENNWCDKLCSIFNEQISSFRKENPELTASDIFKGINLSHYLKLIVAFDIPKRSTVVEVKAKPSKDKSSSSNSSSNSNSSENNNNNNNNSQNVNFRTVYYFDEPVKPIMSGSFFLNICLSLTSPSAVARFMLKYFSVNDFLYFLQGNATKLKPFRIASLMYFIMPDRATFDLLNFPFKTQNRDLITSDIIIMMIAIVSIYSNVKIKTSKNKVVGEAQSQKEIKNDNQKDLENSDSIEKVNNDSKENENENETNDFIKFIIDLANTWLPAFLYDDNRETRNLCVSLCAFLAPCDLFDPNLYSVKIPDDLEIPDLPQVVQRPINDSITLYFQNFLNVCFDSIDVLNEKITNLNNRLQFQPIPYNSSFDDDLATQFLSLVSVLLHVVSPQNGDYSPLISLYSTVAQTSQNPFNEQSTKALILLFDYNVSVDINKLLIPFLRDDIFEITKRNEESIFFSLQSFLPPFFHIFNKIESEGRNKNQDETNDDNNIILLDIPDRFFDVLFRIIVFQSIPFLSKIVDDIYSFLKHLVLERESVKKILSAIIDKYFESLIVNNFWGLCIALSALGELRPEITDFLPDNIDELKNCNVDIDKMVQLAIASSLSQTINKKKLDELLKKFHFNEKTMKMLLSLSSM